MKTENLNQEEKKLHTLLSSIKKDSLWGTVIRNMLPKSNATEFRELCKQLKSEGSANPSAMERIVGKRAWQHIEKLN